MWPARTVDAALRLIASGKTAAEVSAATGIPRRTISDWSNGRRPTRPGGPCDGRHDFSLSPPGSYAYLLGMYLGDGYISAHPRDVWQLRIFCDAQYPGIILECAQAIEALFPSQRAGLRLQTRSDCVEVSLYSKHWPCLVPQHGPGRKHTRPIRLHEWQQEIVAEQRPAFLRGLMHSDGCRFVARQTYGTRTYEWPRYCFSNRSEDIKALFCETCDALGIAWRRAGPKHVYINRREAVALADTFVGPKS
jgi:hypothetical protein